MSNELLTAEITQDLKEMQRMIGVTEGSKSPEFLTDRQLSMILMEATKKSKDLKSVIQRGMTYKLTRLK